MLRLEFFVGYYFDDISLDIVEVDINQARGKALNIYNDIFKDRRPNFYKL